MFYLLSSGLAEYTVEFIYVSQQTHSLFLSRLVSYMLCSDSVACLLRKECIKVHCDGAMRCSRVKIGAVGEFLGDFCDFPMLFGEMFSHGWQGSLHKGGPKKRESFQRGSRVQIRKVIGSIDNKVFREVVGFRLRKLLALLIIKFSER